MEIKRKDGMGIVYFPNWYDFQSKFWENTYLVSLTAQGIPFVVNADCEQDAIDEIIDYCEEHGFDGLLWSDSDISENPDILEEYVCGGNHGRYLSTLNIHIEEI